MKPTYLFLVAFFTFGCGKSPYAKDLDAICHVHEITKKSPKLGFGAVAPWLIDNIRTPEARKQLAEMPEADLIAWNQGLRRDAAAQGISPCPFADYWEEFNRHPPE